jgi:hypothetical protein
MNGFSEAQTRKIFKRPENRFLIVANKFQTGFDQPLLHTMYVDKKLGGVNAVQTLSRLNRTLPPEKQGTTVLDFANEAAEIQAAFTDYYETTLLSEATDPNLLYEIQGRLAAFPVYTQADVERFAKVYFSPRATQDQLYAVLAPVVERFPGDLRGGTARFPGPPHRLRAPLCVPGPGADLPTRTSRSSTPSPGTSAGSCRRTGASFRARCSATSTWSPTACSRRAAGGSPWSAGPVCSTR